MIDVCIYWLFNSRINFVATAVRQCCFGLICLPCDHHLEIAKVNALEPIGRERIVKVSTTTIAKGCTFGWSTIARFHFLHCLSRSFSPLTWSSCPRSYLVNSSSEFLIYYAYTISWRYVSRRYNYVFFVENMVCICIWKCIRLIAVTLGAINY